MHPPPRRPPWPPRLFRWLVFLTFIALWTGALLVRNPVDPEKAHQLRREILVFGKSLHVVAYAGMAGLAGWVQAPGRSRWILLALLPLHAVATEFLQRFTPTRTGSLRDVGLDCLGLAIGLAVSWRWWRAPG
jgi:VanZ family protein